MQNLKFDVREFEDWKLGKFHCNFGDFWLYSLFLVQKIKLSLGWELQWKFLLIYLNPLRPKIRSQKLPSSVLYNSARFASFELKIGTRLFSRVLFKMPFFVFVLKSILTGNMHLKKKKWCHFFVFFFENPNFDPRKVLVPS